jgi:hypothetical protein
LFALSRLTLLLLLLLLLLSSRSWMPRRGDRRPRIDSEKLSKAELDSLLA